MAAPFVIEPLSPQTRAQTKALLNRIFTDETFLDRVNIALMGTPLQFLTNFLGVRQQRVWVAVAEGRVLGVTGLYEDEDDAPAAVWLGWFCVAPEARGRGVGAALLDFSIVEARKTGKPFMRIYTSTDESEKSAQPLYESRGFKVVDKHQPADWVEDGVHQLTRELRLK